MRTELPQNTLQSPVNDLFLRPKTSFLLADRRLPSAANITFQQGSSQ